MMHGKSPHSAQGAGTGLTPFGNLDLRNHSQGHGLLAVAVLCAACLHGCAGPSGHRPADGLSGYRETGMASYYASRFHGRKTASGERLDNNSLTAAHRKLPFGSEVIVRNISNGKTVRVRINDRGPFIRGRIIDLTRTAFARIANPDQGVVRVEIRVAE